MADMDTEIEDTPSGMPAALESVPKAGSSQSVASQSASKRSSQQPVRPQLSRMTSLRRSLSTGVKKSQGAVAHLLGVDHVADEDQGERKAMWEARRKMMAQRMGARPKSPMRVAEEAETVTDGSAHILPVSPDLAKYAQAFRKPTVAEMAWKRITRKVAKGEDMEGEPPTPSPAQMRPILHRMISFAEPILEGVEPLPVDIRIRDETFFDQDPVPLEPARISPEPAQPRDAAAPPGAPAPAYLKSARSLRPVASLRESAAPVAPLAQPEGPDQVDIPTVSEFVKQVVPPPKPRRFGQNFFMRIFMAPFKKSTKDKMYELLDHRPYFTYWVTVVQIIVLVVSVVVYGMAPVGFDARQHSSLILETSLALETVDYLEPENFWLGPRASALILLGAKYAPCMRPDDRINQKIAIDREIENRTACCIRNDSKGCDCFHPAEDLRQCVTESGCVQSSRERCSKTMATWYEWPNSNSPVRNSVCGLDPRFCTDPPSAGAHTWANDITKWPICKNTTELTRGAAAPHMTCEVVGHPCCIGVQGECQITTREYCDFVQGYFHETALLCSQVSCMDKICGMLPFFDPETPDQFYRLWTAIFLHAGFLHILITIIFQYFIMRDTEKLTGWVRMAIIYIMSGVSGNLASAIFTPYVAEVGPSGSQFGVFACVVVEILYSWKLVDRPWVPLLKTLGLAFFLFLVGLFPWTDNYSHIFGFLFGGLLSAVLLPYMAFSEKDRRLKVWIIIVCLIIAAALFAVLIVLFYVHPVYDCEICTYFNCIPFTENFCDYQKIKITDKKKLLN